jgi:hypothetical protein
VTSTDTGAPAARNCRKGRQRPTPFDCKLGAGHAGDCSPYTLPLTGHPDGRTPTAGPDADTLKRAEQIGWQAYAEDYPVGVAPAGHSAIADMIKGYAVGTGAADIFRAYSRGFSAAADHEAERAAYTAAPSEQNPATAADIAPGVPADLAARRAQVRERELLLLLEQWGPGYQRVAGDGVRYAAEIAKATDAEWVWLREYVTAHGIPAEIARNPQEWHRLLRDQGKRASSDANAAFKAGDYETARDLLDDALLYGDLSENAWVRLHAHVTKTEASACDG